MAGEYIASYEVEVGFDSAIKKLEDFDKKMKAFEDREKKNKNANQKLIEAHHRGKENLLDKEQKKQLTREKQLKSAHVAAIKQNIKFDKKREADAIAAKNKPDGVDAHLKAREKYLTAQENARTKRIKDREKAHTAAIKENIKFNKKLADQREAEKRSPDPMIAHLAAREKHLDTQYKKQVTRDKERETAHIAAIKQNIRFDKKRADAANKAGVPVSGGKIDDAHVRAREAENKRIYREEQRRISNLKQAQNTFSRSDIMLRGANNPNDLAAKNAIKEAVAKAKTADEVRMIVAQERARLRVNKQIEKSHAKQNFLMQRMTSSSKQFAGNMISAFALAGIGAGVVKVGQDFESVNNTMLAVSTNAAEAGDNFKFVRDEAYRLGLGLTESGKNFAKMLSARGNMSLEDTKKAFSGVAEMSTLLGLSAEESTRATNALQQMMSKGVVSAEELKLQMGEVLPNAIQIMAKSAKDAGLTVNGTVAEMMALQQTGGLISEKVLPHFAENMSKAARANGGLEKALNSNRVAMNRLLFSFQEAGDLIFKSGLNQGLTEFFNTFAESIVELKPLWETIGKIVGSVFSLISDGIKLITPPLVAISNVFKSIVDQIGDGREYLIAMIGPAAWLGKLFTRFGISISPWIAGISAALLVFKEIAFWAEEIDNLLYSRNKIGVLYDPRQGVNGGRITEGAITASASTVEGYMSAIPFMGDFIKNIDKTISNFTGLPAFFAENYTNKGKIPTVNVVIGADAEKMGITAASSNAVQNLVDNKVREIQN